MSIFPQTAALILREHKREPIAGDVLMIGRQTVCLTHDAAHNLIEREGVEVRPRHLIETDSSTVAASGEQFITDRAFFSMFTDASVIALDVTDYEGAEIVQDLNAPLPDSMCRTADFIFNGSCLDNLFDAASAMRSMSKILRPGGRAFHLEHGTPIYDALICYSPEWFFDFYAVNDYADCRIYVCTFPPSEHRKVPPTLTKTWTVARWLPYAGGVASGASLGIGDFMNVVIAKKGAASTDDRAPIQCQYRRYHADQSEDFYRRKAEEFGLVAEPVFELTGM